MDFLDPAKKRQHQIRLLIGYILVALVVAAVAYLLWLQSYGFGYDRKTGQIIQNGLIYVDSHPVSADVFVDGQHKGNTSVKLTLPGGSYDILLTSSGYRNWTATANLAGGGVIQLTYPFLVPQKLVTKDIQAYPKAPYLATTSPDRHWLLLLKPDSVSDFDVYDITKAKPVATSLKLPAGLFKSTTGAQTLKLVEWSSDNRHLLLEHNYKGGSEFVVIDRAQASKSYNINSLLNIVPTNVSLHNKKYDQLYAYIAKTKTLLSANASTKQVNPLLRHVVEYKAGKGDTIIYVSDAEAPAGQYAVNYWDGHTSYLLHNYPAKTNYLLDSSNFSGNNYVAVAPAKNNKLYIFKNPLPTMKSGKVPNPFIALKTVNPQFISFANNGQYVMAQSGNSFSAYDFDADLWHYFTLKDKVPLKTKAFWMDNNRLILNNNSKYTIFDFNGANAQALSPTLPGFSGFFDSGYKNLYTVGPSTTTPNHPALTATSMVVKR